MAALTAWAGRVQVFGVEHLIILTASAIAAVVVFMLGRHVTPVSARRFELAAGAAILLVCTPFEAIDWTHGPQLQLCDFAWLVAAGALLTRTPGVAAVAYFWGLTLSVQGVLTPDLSHGFPSADFWGFVARHLSPVWVGVYLVAVRRGPSWRGLMLTSAITAAWAAAMMVLNHQDGTNYGYLNHKPPTHSLLDLFGPWPQYVVIEMALLLGVWTAMTWPWNRTRSRP